MYLINLRSLRLMIYLSGMISVFLIIYYIYISNYNKNILKQNERKINFLMMQQQRVSNYMDSSGRNPQMKQQQKEILKAINQMTETGEIIPEKYDEKVIKNRIIREKVKIMSEAREHPAIDSNLNVFTMDDELLIYNKTLSNIMIFYYLPVKWNRSGNQSDQLNTIFYPKRGLYNYSTVESASNLLKAHFDEIRLCGVGVVIIHWTPNNSDLNQLLPLIFRITKDMNFNNHQNQLKIAIQIGDYSERTVESIRNNIKFFVDNFTINPCFFKVFVQKKQKALPFFYIQKAERIKDWNRILGKNGLLTIRGTSYDSVIIAHLE
jgi:glycoprotein endo-alpha-1,2-mannosidase